MSDKKNRKPEKYKRVPIKEIIVFDNPQKRHNEKWYEGRDIANLPCPFRAVFTAPCGLGKTNLALNLVVQAKPFYDEIILVHVDPENHSEWDVVEPSVVLTEIPPVSYFTENEKKKLLIIEDVPVSNKDVNLSNLFRYVSTHYKVSVILLYQKFTQIPLICRETSDIFAVWKVKDHNQLELINKRVGFPKGRLLKLLKEFCPDPHDCVVVDYTKGSPYPLRKNLIYPIVECEDSDED